MKDISDVNNIVFKLLKILKYLFIIKRFQILFYYPIRIIKKLKKVIEIE